MDDYLEKLLARQEVDSSEEQSGGVLKKLNEEINASAGNAVGASPAVRQRGETALAEKYASEQKRDAALIQMAAQLTEALQGGTMGRRTVSSTEKPEESAGWSYYGFISAEQRQETPPEQNNLSMDALSRFFERDARRYPG